LADGTVEMKQMIKGALSLVGIGIYRLNPPPDVRPPNVKVTSPLHFNSKDGMDEYYSDIEFVESKLEFAFYDRMINLLLDHGVDYNEKRIADVGCGTGRLLRSMQAKFQPASLTGFEYSENALKHLRSNGSEIEFCHLDIYKGTSRQFDVLFCIEVLEHLLHPDLALRNLVRMLAPSGTALITVPNGRIDTWEGHINFWSPESWKVFLESNSENCEVTSSLLEDDTVNFAIIRRRAAD